MHTYTARVHENVYKPPQIKPRTYNIVHLEIHYRGTVCVDVERRYLTNARVVSLRKQTPETKALKPCQRCNDLAHWVPRGPMVSPTSFRDMRSICYQTQRGRSGKDKVPRLDISTTRRVPTPTDTSKEHLSNPCCFNQPRGHLSASAPRGCGAIAIYRFESVYGAAIFPTTTILRYSRDLLPWASLEKERRALKGIPSLDRSFSRGLLRCCYLESTIEAAGK